VLPTSQGIRTSSGINVVGTLSAGTGLGAAGRSTLRTLDERQIPHVAVDIAPTAGTIREPLPESTRRFPTFADLPYSVTMFQMNPDMLDLLVLRWSRVTGFDLSRTVNAIVPFWELPTLPAGWPMLLEFTDVVMAPTRFIKEAVVAGMGDGNRPVVMDYPQAIQPPQGVLPARERWFGLRADRTTFLLTFDLLSDIERKNPWAAVRAFQTAFEGRDDVSLVIKVNHAMASSLGDRFARLQDVAREDGRVRLMTDPLTRDDLWSLCASADAYVSLHRAEGLGLGLMEAMAVGTPVVATGWSGNMDFMDARNSILVPYRLVPVGDASHLAYASERTQEWAEPGLDAAVEGMRRLADSAETRERLGAEALKTMELRWERQTAHGALDQLLELDAEGVGRSEAHSRRARAARRYIRAQRVAPANLMASAKHLGVRALRRVGLKPPPPPEEYQGGLPRILS